MGSGPAAVGVVEQDGLADAGELTQQFPDGSASGAGGAKAHQVGDLEGQHAKTCTRMLCSVQWCIGENETACGSLIWRKENSASDWDRYPATTSGTGQSS